MQQIQNKKIELKLKALQEERKQVHNELQEAKEINMRLMRIQERNKHNQEFETTYPSAPSVMWPPGAPQVTCPLPQKM